MTLPLLGPMTLSGFEHAWFFLFLFVVLAIVALYVVARFLNVPHSKVNHRVDYWGAAALTVTLVPLLIVAEQGR